MLEFYSKDKRALLTILIFILLTIWWSLLPKDTNDGGLQFFAACYGIIALMGGIWGISISQHWGGLKSVFGKAILMFSFGLFAQEFGQLMYSYYIYLRHLEVPYPSLGDIGYFSSIPLYIYGVILLAKASGVKIALRSYIHQMSAIILPLIMLIVTYWHFLKDYQFDWSSPLRIFLDFGYPLGQAIYISLAILTFFLSSGVLGGVMKNKIRFLILALLIQYIADYTFLYQASKGLWYAGGINDYIYLLAYFVMTLGLLQLNTIYLGSKSKT